MAEEVDVAEVVRETTAMYVAMSIDIPRIIVVPKGEVVCRYDSFDLDVSSIRLRPVAENILIQHLHDHEQFRLEDGSGVIPEEKLEDYLVRGLVDFDDIDYYAQADLLYELSRQAVAHLRTYLDTDEDVQNVLQYHQHVLVSLIHSQMQEHYMEEVAGFEVIVSKGYTTLTPNTCSARAGETPRDFRVPVEDRSRIRSLLFWGFRKCLYPIQKFDADPERRFSVVLESDATVIKWFRPSQQDIRIHLDRGEGRYEPDFVAEAADRKYLCEVKRASDMDDPDVKTKAQAGALWCERASEHSDKPWIYLLIPDGEITDASTMEGLEARNAVRVAEPEPPLREQEARPRA